jgi:hypothetical protein
MLQVLVTISQSFITEMRHRAMQKLFMEKEEKKWERKLKNGQVSKISKIMGTLMPV